MGLKKTLGETTRRRAKILASLIEPRIPYLTGEARSTLAVHHGGAPGTRKDRADPELTVDVVEGNPDGLPGEYVRYLEFGTQKMDPQPHFYPTFRQERPNIHRAWRRAIRLFIRSQSKS